MAAAGIDDAVLRQRLRAAVHFTVGEIVAETGEGVACYLCHATRSSCNCILRYKKVSTCVSNLHKNQFFSAKWFDLTNFGNIKKKLALRKAR